MSKFNIGDLVEVVQLYGKDPKDDRSFTTSGYDIGPYSIIMTELVNRRSIVRVVGVGTEFSLGKQNVIYVEVPEDLASRFGWYKIGLREFDLQLVYTI